MRFLKKLSAGVLLFALLLGAAGSSAAAAEEEYTYTVKLYAGNQGQLVSGGIEVVSSSASVAYGGDCTTVTGLKYGDTVYIRPQEAAASTDERYYVKGVRRSGRDNSEAEAPAFRVACDRDYVVAYGISGDLVAYRVNYLDMNGNQLMESDSYYGNIGERQYVSARYVEGYEPQALNLVKTLSANEVENVFEFRYAPVRSGTGNGGDGTGGTGNGGAGTGTGNGGAGTGGTGTGTGTGNGGTGTGGTGTGTGNGGTGTGTGADGTGNGGTGAGAEADGAGTDGADTGAQGENIPEGDVPTGGDAGVTITDDQLPLAQQNVMELDDEEVPLAVLGTEQTGMRMGYLFVYAGIGAAALLILGGAALYLNRRRKMLMIKSGKKQERKSSDDRKQK